MTAKKWHRNLKRVCALDGCDNVFTVTTWDEVHCSTPCIVKDRAQMLAGQAQYAAEHPMTPLMEKLELEEIDYLLIDGRGPDTTLLTVCTNGRITLELLVHRLANRTVIETSGEYMNADPYVLQGHPDAKDIIDEYLASHA